jgi:hypothetical protein
LAGILPENLQSPYFSREWGLRGSKKTGGNHEVELGESGLADIFRPFNFPGLDFCRMHGLPAK